MKKIQMVDLVSQYEKIKPSIDEAIQDVIQHAHFINGPAVNRFQSDLEEYLGVDHVIPCANGTDALQIAMMALGLSPGDEVITPSFTYIATTEVIALLHLVPVFVEVDPHTFCIDPNAIKAAITPKTKAIVPVHLYGQAANMNEIMKIARENGLFVIEDNAQAIGSDYHLEDGRKVKTGTIGDIGCTSFFPSKNLGCYGDGGALCTNNAELAKKIRMIANHGQEQKYVHDVVGCNSRLDTIQAAVLQIKLRQLDNYIDARREVAAKYDEAFAGIPGVKIPFRSDDSKHVFHQYTLVLENANRNELQQHLTENEIPSMIYYPIPAHKQKMFAHFGSSAVQLPTTDWLTERVISLPIHTEMLDDQQDYIIDCIRSFFKQQ
ncbi:MAG: DegT/DnrJ/EryC1/StrS family aminotransferase [Crocinitomicaceae bacterium]